MKEKISLKLARRIVLAAQGFAEPKPAGPIDRRYLKRVLARLGLFEIEANGPVDASGFDGNKGSGGWWGWSDAKHAFEYLFWAGRITTSSREGFQRYYDLPELVLPKAIVEAAEPVAADAHRELLRHS